MGFPQDDLEPLIHWIGMAELKCHKTALRMRKEQDTPTLWLI